MRNLKLVIAFDGTNYGGWQRQKNSATIQGVLEEKISLMTRAARVTLHGAGRTDAGVHALAMTANFQTNSSIPCEGLRKGLNSMLPKDIVILSVEEADDSFHARFSAKGKSYLYHITTAAILLPTQRLYNVHEPRITAIPAMRNSLALLEGEHDFSSFEASGSRDREKRGGRGAVRRLFQTDLLQDEMRLTIHLRGDGFLRHMVRNIAGTLMLVGRGELSVDQFDTIFQGRDRSLAGPTAPAHGLFLEEVYYEQ